MNEQVALARKELSEVRSEIDKGLELIQDFEISNDEDQELAAEILRDVKEKYRGFEDKRKTITGPLNVALKEVNNLFRPMRVALESCERLLKSKISGYQAKQDAANRLALQEAQQAESTQEASEALAKVETVQSPQGVNVRHVWKAVVVDVDKVPRLFLSPDLDKLAEYAAQFDGEPGDVAGVRFEQVAIVTSRRVS